jgi:hypothetical protein
MFNDMQLTTMEEVDQVVAKLNGAGIGGGVASVYLPTWSGPFPEPRNGDSRQYCLTYENGSTGHNVGLIKNVIERNPVGWEDMLRAEAIPPQVEE